MIQQLLWFRFALQRTVQFASLAVARYAFGALAGLLVSLSAQPVLAQGFSDQSQEPIVFSETVIPAEWVLHIDANGRIIDVQTGQELSAAAVQEQVVRRPIWIGIIIGAGSGALGAVVSGGNWGQIAAAGLIGGVAGFYGSVAAIATGTGRLIYGAAAVAYGGPVTSIVGSAPSGGPGGNCAVETDSQNCLVKPK